MSAKSLRTVIVLSAVFFVTAFWAIDASGLPQSDGADHPGRSADVHAREAAFRAALVANGFIVNDGYAHPVDPISDLFDSGIGDSACANNVQPYKVLEIPSSPTLEQEIPPIEVFRLRPDEAIVYVGPTPPRSDYFSFTPYLWVRRQPTSRIGNVEKGDWVFAAVNDPLNNGLIKTEGNGNPFHKQTIVVFTADRGVYERVATLAQAAGYPESMINPYILPSALLYLGVLSESPKSDSFVIIVRTANFASAAEGNNYLHNDFYARVWRITPNPAPAPRPFATPPPRNRKWISEASLFPDLQDGLERLKRAIMAQTPHAQSESFESLRWWPASRKVVKENHPESPIYHKFIAGEASDTPYLRTAKNNEPANFILGNDDMVVVYGVNHAATGLATYSSFVVYGDWITSSCDTTVDQWEYVFGCGDPIWNGVVGNTSHDFSGSAEQYIPGDPMAPYLYAVKVLRNPPTDKHEKYWIVVPETAPEGESPDHGIALDKPITIGYRAYLNPATNAGPDYDDIIWDRAIWFKLR